MRMHGENSHTGQTSKGVHLRKQGLAKAKFACAERTNYSLALAQNRGFCAKKSTQCPKRARRAVHGLRERGICVDEGEMQAVRQ